MNAVLIGQLIQLFLIMFLGYILYKTGLFTDEFNAMLTRLVLECTLPLQILSSVMNPEGGRDYKSVGLMFFYTSLVYALFILIGIMFSLLLPYRREEKGIYIFTHVFSNVGFMGFPIIDALFGSEALIYTAIINIMFNLLAFTIGVVMMNYQPSGDTKSAGSGLKQAFRKIRLKDLLSPGFLGIALSVVVYFIPVTFPEVITGTVEKVGDVTSPLAMLIIGSTLAKLPLKEVFSDVYVYVFLVVRQILIPLMVYPVFRLFLHDEMICNVMFILFAMPVGNTVVMFSTQYGADERLAARLVFITTICSAVTIPLVLAIAGIG